MDCVQAPPVAHVLPLSLLQTATVEFCRTASDRASWSAATISFALAVNLLLRINVPNAGTATAITIARTATVTISSISVKADSRLPKAALRIRVPICPPDFPVLTVSKTISTRHLCPTGGLTRQANGATSCSCLMICYARAVHSAPDASAKGSSGISQPPSKSPVGTDSRRVRGSDFGDGSRLLCKPLGVFRSCFARSSVGVTTDIGKLDGVKESAVGTPCAVDRLHSPGAYAGCDPGCNSIGVLDAG